VDGEQGCTTSATDAEAGDAAGIVGVAGDHGADGAAVSGRFVDGEALGGPDRQVVVGDVDGHRLGRRGEGAVGDGHAQAEGAGCVQPGVVGHGDLAGAGVDGEGAAAVAADNGPAGEGHARVVGVTGR